jgi:hypothetical protein
MTDLESRLRTAMQTIKPPSSDPTDQWGALATRLDGVSVGYPETVDSYITETVDLRRPKTRVLGIAAALVLIAGVLAVLADRERATPVRVTAPPELPRLLLAPAPNGLLLERAIDGLATS